MLTQLSVGVLFPDKYAQISSISLRVFLDMRLGLSQDVVQSYLSIYCEKLPQSDYDLVRQCFSPEGLDVAIWFAVQSAFFGSGFHAGNHNSSLNSDHDSSWQIDHAVPRFLARVRAAALLINNLINMGPMLASLNRTKGAHFDPRAHFVQCTRAVVFFVYLLIESKRPLTEFAECASLDNFIRRAAQRAEQWNEDKQLKHCVQARIGASVSVEHPTFMDMLESEDPDIDAWCNRLLGTFERSLGVASTGQGVSLTTSVNMPIDLQSYKSVDPPAGIRAELHLPEQLKIVSVERIIGVPEEYSFEHLEALGMPTNDARAYSDLQSGAFYSTPADRVMAAAIQECRRLSRASSPEEHVLRIANDPLSSLEAICALNRTDGRIKEFGMSELMVPLYGLFEELLSPIDSSAALCRESMEWLKSRIGRTQIDFVAAGLIRDIFPYIRREILPRLSYLNDRLHFDAGIIF